MSDNVEYLTPPVDRTYGSNLIAALQEHDRQILLPMLSHATYTEGTVLHEPGDEVAFAHVPCGRSLVSFRVVLADGRSVETALVGREGAVGGIVSQGFLPAYTRMVVQIGGQFLKIALTDLQRAKSQSAAIKNLFDRYSDCLLAQVFQATACNATHSVEARAAKWILATMSRTAESEMVLTQEQLGGFLGVGRSYVSRIIQTLKRDGIISTRRGRLIVDDPAKLHQLSCDCDTLVRRHFDNVLEGVYPPPPLEIAT